jgi:hypothetical protein
MGTREVRTILSRSAYRALVESNAEQEMVQAGAVSSSDSEKREV